MGSVESEEKRRMVAWVENWKNTAPRLEQLKRQTIRRTNTCASIAALDLAFKSALRNTPPRTETGLVEFQRLLGKLSEK
jgi:hypothetical protein